MSSDFRTNLAQLISPLRRVRARVPFYHLAAHRIPTLWSLYRGLLTEAPSDNIRFRIRMLFRQNQHLTGTSATKTQLLNGYKWLHIFVKARGGDEHLQTVLRRYDKLITTKREKEHWKRLLRNELAWQTRLRNRPILTGGYLRATFANKPLPRMKPQPLAITRIIAKRRAAKERRLRRLTQLYEWRDDLRRERQFEERLANEVNGEFPRVYSGSNNAEEWERPIMQAQKGIYDSFRRDTERANTPYTPEMLAAIKQARREKIANKTRERQRERRGEILQCTVLRRNKGPPAHVLQKMTKEEREMDKVVRSVSEVGYVGQVKRRLGFRLRDPQGWKREIGDVEDKERLDRMVRDIRDENERRRRMAIRGEKDGLLPS